MAHLLAAVPILPVDDLDRALAYYQDCLGFDLAWTWGDPPTTASVCRDDVEINLSRRGPNGPRGVTAVYIRVDDVDDYYAECHKHGATITSPLTDQPYGMRDFAVTDPSGNKLDFGEAIVE